MTHPTPSATPGTPAQAGTPDDSVAQAAQAIRRRNPDADPLTLLPDVHPGKIPRHVAIIMDGNGRWANARGLPRELGHQAGAKVVRRIVEHASDLGIEYVTLYSFSLENWKRPPHEVAALMHLCIAYLAAEGPELVRRGVRFRVIGRREGLPREVLEAIDHVTRTTAAGTRGELCLAINYSARAELADAARAVARDVTAGVLTPEQVDEAALEQRLTTRGMPDPDLLVRTAGEMRLSNFLLWQVSYSELYVTPKLWPDFVDADLDAAVRAFASRERRFGGLMAMASGGGHA